MTDDNYQGWWVEICDCGWSSAPVHEQPIAAGEGREHQKEEHNEIDVKYTYTAPLALVAWVQKMVKDEDIR